MNAKNLTTTKSDDMLTEIKELTMNNCCGMFHNFQEICSIITDLKGLAVKKDIVCQHLDVQKNKLLIAIEKLEMSKYMIKTVLYDCPHIKNDLKRTLTTYRLIAEMYAKEKKEMLSLMCALRLQVFVEDIDIAPA